MSFIIKKLEVYIILSKNRICPVIFLTNTWKLTQKGQKDGPLFAERARTQNLPWRILWLRKGHFSGFGWVLNTSGFRKFRSRKIAVLGALIGPTLFELH